MTRLSQSRRAASAWTGGAGAALLLLGACRPPPAPAPAPVRAEWLVMGTCAAVSLPAGAAADLPAVRESVRDALDGVERELSAFRPDSDLSRLNAAAGGPAVPLGTATATVLAYALEMSRASGGAFDPTVGPWMALWGFRADTPPLAPPTTEDISRVRAVTGWERVSLTLAGAHAPTNSAALDTAGSRVDLGGIAKGYGVDLAYDRLRAAGRDDFLVDLAGNMRGHGRAAADRTGWRIGVRDPFGRRPHLGVLTLGDGEAVATSGNYERFVTIAGRRYAHIIDPRRGAPVSGMAGVTVLARSAMEADALSTSLFVLGPAEGAGLLARHPGCEALYVPDAQPLQVVLTPGFARRFRAADDVRAAVRVLPAP